jgi:hypothetical protein
VTGTLDRRRLGALLLAFGASGLLLIGIALAFVAGGAGDDGAFGLDVQRRRLVALVDASDRAIDSARAAARDGDDSLTSTATAAGSAAGMMGELAATLRELAASLRVSVLGSQPFAPAADDMDRVATRAATVAADLDGAASSVASAAEEMATLADDLAAMRAELDAIRGGLAQPIDAGAWRLLVGALLAWLAIPAVASVAVGLRWVSRSRPAPATAAPVLREAPPPRR